VPESPEAREWHRIIRASVRECLETWHLQSKDAPVTVHCRDGAAMPRLESINLPGGI
jgi:hypothetical protein